MNGTATKTKNDEAFLRHHDDLMGKLRLKKDLTNKDLFTAIDATYCVLRRFMQGASQEWTFNTSAGEQLESPKVELVKCDGCQNTAPKSGCRTTPSGLTLCATCLGAPA